MTNKIRNKIKEISTNNESEQTENQATINKMYNAAWKYILMQFKIDYLKYDYYYLPLSVFENDNWSNKKECIETVIKMLMNDGFEKNSNSNELSLKIYSERIIEFIKDDKKENKNIENITKMPITPFAETRRR